jgi:hypothetical protein
MYSSSGMAWRGTATNPKCPTTTERSVWEGGFPQESTGSQKAAPGARIQTAPTSAWVAVVELVADLAVALGSGLQVLPREHNHLGRADHATCWPRAARSLRALSSSRALRRRRRRQQRESWERVGIHQGQRGCEGARRRWRGAGSGMEPADGAGWI